MELTRAEAVDFVRQIGDGNLTAFCVMQLLAEDDGVNDHMVCVMPKELLADTMGLSVETLRRRIRELERLGLVAPAAGGYKLADVTIGQICRVNVIKDLKSLKDSKRSKSTKGSKELSDVKSDVSPFKHWLTAYNDHYGTPYSPSNWAREQTMMKRLVAKYGGDSQRVINIIDVVMRLYGSKWASTKFPRPTIGALVSWIAAQAEPFVQAAQDVAAEPEIEIDMGDLFGESDKRFGL